MNLILLSLLVGIAAEPPSHEAFSAPVSVIRYSPDGSRVALGSLQGHISLFDSANWNRVATFKPGSSRVTDISISPDNSLLAFSSQDKTIRLVRMTGEPVHTWTSDGWGTCVDFSLDGKRVAGVFADGLLRVWNVSDGKQTWDSEPSALRAVLLRWHPSGDRLVFTDASGWIAAMEPGSGKLHGPNKDHAGTPRFLTFGPRGETVLVSHARGGNTPSLVLVDAKSLATRANFESLCTDAWVTPDGAQVVALGGDGEVRLFDVPSVKRTYKANPISKFRFFMPQRMAMSPDGRVILLAGDLGGNHGFYVIEVASLKP